MIGGLRQAVEAAYSRFVLLDIFAKVVPGSVVLASTVASLSSWDALLQRLGRMPWWVFLLVLGASWTAAFAVQSLGEAIRLLRDLPNKYSDRADWYKRLKTFEATASDVQKQQAARLLVIKEACGNGALALVFAVVLNLSRATAGHWPLLLVALAVFLALLRMHHEHTTRHQIYVDAVIG